MTSRLISPQHTMPDRFLLPIIDFAMMLTFLGPGEQLHHIRSGTGAYCDYAGWAALDAAAQGPMNCAKLFRH